MEAKNNPEKQVVAPKAAALHPEERTNFKSFILVNPNHFGNMPELGFKPVKPMSFNTAYEQLMCVGLNPDADTLEAVVNIKHHTGYDGDACTNGSREYVRFFVERAGVWNDLGDVALNVYDTPDGSPLPLSYSLAMGLNEARKYCTEENLVNIRAILSWTWEPPAGNATWTPPWGNVLDVKVQIAPLQFWKVPLVQLIADKQLVLESDVLATIDPTQTLQAASLKPMSYSELKATYGNKVPGHRFGFSEAQKLLAAPLDNQMLAAAKTAPTPAKAELQAAPPFTSAAALAVGPELGAIIAALQNTQGDTTYEQLECAGYNPQTRMLGGVITLKQNGGYSGNLCSPGSTEYVGFWLFYSGAWHSLGSAQVQVHDLPDVKLTNPVQYAVFRGVNVPEYLCQDIVGLPMRAILSWSTPPTGPNFTPVWGNILDTDIQPIITNFIDDNERVRLMRVNRVGISGISNVAENVGLGLMIGLADPTGDAQDCSPIDSPFGGPIFVEGDFTIRSDAYFNPTNGQVLPGAKPLRYTVQVEGINPVSAPVLLTNDVWITIFPANPPVGSPSTLFQNQFVNVDGLTAYKYMEGNIQAVNPRTLAVWDAGGLPEGQYRITVTGYEWNGAAYVPLATGSQTKDIYIFNGYPHSELLVDGTTAMFYRPEVHLQITGVLPGGVGPLQPAQDCGDITVGDTIQGSYSVTDRFFGTLGLTVPQITVSGVPQPMGTLTISGPASYPAAGTTGTSGTWLYNTTGMTPCGYEVILSSWDRSLVGDSCTGHYNQIAVGFCLRAAD